MNSIDNYARTAESLIRDLERLRGVPCASCGAPVCTHQVLISIALGFKDESHCLPCIGVVLNRDLTWLRDFLFDYIRQRECYSRAWNWANRDAGLPESIMPPSMQSLAAADARHAPVGGALDTLPNVSQTDAEWDAGDLGGGELVLELRVRLDALAPGKLFHLTARDAGAPEALAAWCRLTGHTLVHAEHPNYWIQRRG